MKLSMDILSDELKDSLCFARIMEDSDLTLEGVRFLDESAGTLSSQLVYVGSRIPEERPDHFNMLYFGPLEPGDIPKDCSILVMDCQCQIHAVFNRVLNIFQMYSIWERTLQDFLADSAPLDRFLDVSQPILRTGIVLLDWDHNCVAVTRIKMEGCPLWDAILNGYGYKYKYVIENSSPKLSDITKAKVIQQNWSNLDQRYLYNSVINVNGLPMFGLGLHKIEEPTVPFGKHTTQLFEMLVDVVGRRLNDESRRSPSRGVLYDGFIRDVISGELKDPVEMNRKNNFIRFSPGDHLTMGIVEFKNVSYRSKWLEERSQELESLWPGSVCSVIDRQLLWIINLKGIYDYSLVSGRQKERVDQWMKERAARCGVSPSFTSLANMRQSYQQAFSSLHYGLACGGEHSRYVYCYFDSFEYQLLSLASTTVDLTTLVHPVLHTLIAFDEAHKTGYYETLKTYLLNEHSMTFNEMAELLHLHRNTFHYRLDKIREITGVDFKDRSVKMRLALSIYSFDLFPDCAYGKCPDPNPFSP